MWYLTRSYWSSEEKLQAWGLLAVIVGLSLGYVYLQVLYNEWFNHYYSALQEYDWNGIVAAFKEFCILATLNIIVVVYLTYLQQMLEIKWRCWLTERYVGRWLADKAYYRMQLTDKGTDNPDQRISEDLHLFTNMSINLSLGLFRAVVTLISFVAILWQLSGVMTIPLGQQRFTIYGSMVWVAVGYSIVGTWLTHKIGKPLVKLNFEQQRYEADFRFSLVRLRENSESIALFGGEKEEQRAFMNRFQKVLGNFWEIMRRQKQLTWFTAGFGQASIFIRIMLALPRYFAKEIQLGGLMQIATAFDNVREAFSFFVDAYSQLAQWRSVVDRLTGFDKSMADTSQAADREKIERVSSPSRVLATAGLNIKLPDGRPLLEQLNLELAAGDSLLVAGPSGSGKSTLLRTLAGIWPYAAGRVAVPPDYKALFLPQKPYLPLGTLREALLYPKFTNVSAQEIREVMNLCKLDKLAGMIDKTEDWSHVLSLGEQQRIAFARVLLTKPNWLFLDEATSALDEPTERYLYSLLTERLPDITIVSVGHRNTLTSYHKKKLTLDGTGKWSLLN